MNKETQAPPEEQTPEINNNPKKNQGIVPTWVGIVLIVLLVGSFIFLFLKFQEANKSSSVVTSATRDIQNKTAISNQEQTGNIANQSADNSTDASGTERVSSSNVDIDYELKKMDDSTNSINEKDFDSNSFSDAQIGL